LTGKNENISTEEKDNMALVEKYHVVAAIQKVDPSSAEIKEGMLVTLTTAGVKRVDAGTVNRVYGVAGDTFSQSASAMPGIDKMAVVGAGAKASWQGRVSDAFDDTRSSGKITVYNSGGEFGTDQFVDANVAAGNINNILVASTGGLLQSVPYVDIPACIAASRQPVAMLTLAKGAYPSGVPGVDVLPNNDIALKGDNGNTYIEFKLLV
jgi:hypothetical protein